MLGRDSFYILVSISKIKTFARNIKAAYRKWFALQAN